ncbi:hypothetical protein RKD30_001832 [Streptomyces pristinaespiralis]
MPTHCPARRPVRLPDPHAHPLSDPDARVGPPATARGSDPMADATPPTPTAPYATPEQPRVAVRGEARIEFDPEIARIGITISARGKDRRTALEDLTRRNAAALDLVKSYGPAVEKLETGAFSVTPQLTQHGRSERIHAYHGRVHITAVLNDFTALGELTTRLADLELTHVNGPRWSLRPRLTRPRRSPPPSRTRSRPARPRIRRSHRRPALRPRRTRRHRSGSPRPLLRQAGPTRRRPRLRRRRRGSGTRPRPRTPAPDRLRAGERALHDDTAAIVSRARPMLIRAPLRTIQHLSIALHAKVVE